MSLIINVVCPTTVKSVIAQFGGKVFTSQIHPLPWHQKTLQTFLFNYSFCFLSHKIPVFSKSTSVLISTAQLCPHTDKWHPSSTPNYNSIKQDIKCVQKKKVSNANLKLFKHFITVKMLLAPNMQFNAFYTVFLLQFFWPWGMSNRL